MSARTRDVRLDPAVADDRPAVARLWQLYLHELSAYDDSAPGADGFYDPGPYFDRYWSEADRFPYRLTVDGRVVGFALVRRLDVDSHQMAEFFVVAGERRKGIGRAAARRIFDRFPGRWEVAQMRRNAPAQSFWRAVVQEYTAGRYDERTTDSPAEGVMQVFEAAPASRLQEGRAAGGRQPGTAS